MWTWFQLQIILILLTLIKFAVYCESMYVNPKRINSHYTSLWFFGLLMQQKNKVLNLSRFQNWFILPGVTFFFFRFILEVKFHFSSRMYGFHVLFSFHSAFWHKKGTQKNKIYCRKFTGKGMCQGVERVIFKNTNLTTPWYTSLDNSLILQQRSS